jgi:hypothetical protein
MTDNDFVTDWLRRDWHDDANPDPMPETLAEA